MTAHAHADLDSRYPRQDPVDFERHFRSKFKKQLNDTCKYTDDAGGHDYKSNQDLLIGMMQDSFPQGSVPLNIWIDSTSTHGATTQMCSRIQTLHLKKRRSLSTSIAIVVPQHIYCLL